MGFDNGMNCGFEDFCKGGKKEGRLVYMRCVDWDLCWVLGLGLLLLFSSLME